jgi:hypothetical protein
MRRVIAWMCLLVAIAGIMAGTLPQARATIQDDSCLYPDVEYPMPCDEDDDD